MQVKDIKVLKIVGVLLAVVLTVGAVGLLAQGPPPGATGRGQGQGFGPGQGMGPGRGMGPGMGRGFGPGGPGRGPGMMLRGLRELNLTDAQKASIKAILETHKSEVKAVADAAIPARKKLHEAVMAVPVNEDAIREAALAVGKIDADGAVLRAKIHAAVWALLTDEQQAKAQALQNKMRQRGGMRLNQFRERAGKILNEALHSLL
jgi:Spy/CpxP family protein refolding chaperone